MAREGMVDLRSLEVGRDEDIRGQAQGRRGRRRCPGQVAGGGAGERVDPELDGSGRRDSDRPVLEREAGVARVVLDEETLDPDLAAQSLSRKKGCRSDRQAAGWLVVDR